MILLFANNLEDDGKDQLWVTLCFVFLLPSLFMDDCSTVSRDNTSTLLSSLGRVLGGV